MQSGMRKISAFRDSARIVKYSKCAKGVTPDDDLDDVTVVSTAIRDNVRYGAAGGCATANGPRVVPGIITQAGGETTCLVSGGGGGMPLSSGTPSEKQGSDSRQSLIDTVTSRVESYAFVNRAHAGSEPEIPAKKPKRPKDPDKTPRRWTFVFDPAGRLCYYWSTVVSAAFLYNLWVIIYRFAFQEINSDSLRAWFALDYLADLTYLLDILVHFRTGFLEEGVLQTDPVKLRQHYLNSTLFYVDCLCLLPLDCLYLSLGFNSILRCFRLVKVYRFWAFLDRTERHTNWPNVFRALSLTHYVLVVFHWNACLFHIVSRSGGFGSRDWFGPKEARCGEAQCEYLRGLYWSVLALTTIGDLPRPRTRGEHLFLVLELVAGLFLFAAVLGHVANIVTNVSAARKEFQAKLDAVKTYMRMRRVPEHLTVKVIRWFDYLWLTQKSSDEERSVGCLPDKLKAEIAIHVHLDTLKRVEIFQNTEAGFLCELVLRLRPVLFSPGDYICRKGEVGKEMYIVNRGRLQVVTDNGKTVLATLRAGSYFGEISVLNLGTAGNRRTASVRSVGYSDLFCLDKQDMWDVLKDYPAARLRLEAIAVKRLQKYKKDEDLNNKGTLSVQPASSSMGRCRSTPGLVESRGQVPLEDMRMEEHHLGATICTNFLSPSPIVQPASSVQSCASDSTNRTNYASNNLVDQQLHPYQHHQPLRWLHQQPRELLLAEVKRLRERLASLEADNASMSLKLSQQQWEVESRLGEIEMQLCSTPSPSLPSPDDNNQESII